MVLKVTMITFLCKIIHPLSFKEGAECQYFFPEKNDHDCELMIKEIVCSKSMFCLYLCRMSDFLKKSSEPSVSAS